MTKARQAGLLLFLCVAAGCRIEKASSGRPPGQPNEADSLAAVEQDSASRVQVEAALLTYYDRLQRGDWGAWRGSFWPGAVITTRATPPGESRQRIWVQNVDEFVRRSPETTHRPPVFIGRILHLDVKSYGDLADAWVVFERRTGATRDSLAASRSLDAFHLYRHGGEWRIAGLAFARELPGRSLAP